MADGLLGRACSPERRTLCKSLRAAFESCRLAGQAHRERRAWEAGLETLPDAIVARNVILDHCHARRFVAATYARDPQLGLLLDIFAVTGARPSQAARLLVEDLHGGAKPRPTMPRSRRRRIQEPR